MIRKPLKLLLAVIILIIAFVVILFLPYLQFRATSTTEGSTGSSIQVVGHRGAAGLAPENTLSGFEKALELGVDIIELDVHQSKDGRLIVIHDSNLKRTTGFDGEVEDLTLPQIRSHDAGSWFGEPFRGERIPTLDQVFKKVNGQCTLLIEIKWPKQGIYDGIVKEILKSIEKYQAQDWTIIQSFEPKYLHQLHALNPETKSHQLLFMSSKWLPIYYDRKLHWRSFQPLPFVESVNTYYQFLPAVTSIDKVQTGVYTVNDIEEMIRIQRLGASYLITDRPDLARDLFK